MIKSISPLISHQCDRLNRPLLIGGAGGGTVPEYRKVNGNSPGQKNGCATEIDALAAHYLVESGGI